MRPDCILKLNAVVMKRKALRRLRLSPNEESQLIREEQDRRRKIRIQQVRKNSYAHPKSVRYVCVCVQCASENNEQNSLKAMELIYWISIILNRATKCNLPVIAVQT